MTMLEEIRAKWCDSLVDLLECPICNEIPKTYIYQCMSGHHICRNCRNKITKCPICGDYFGKSRNYLAEELSDILENIMTSLMYPAHQINKCILKNKICVYTQTQEISKKSMEIQTENVFLNEDKFTQTENIRRNEENFNPIFLQRKYSCYIGSCDSSLPYENMKEHLKSYHADAFFIFQEKNGIFQKQFELEYIVPEDHDVAFLIENMGIFFVNIKILHTGDLTGAIYVASNTLNSKQYTYVLKIGSGKDITVHSGMVKRCKKSRTRAPEDCFFKKFVEMRKILLPNGNFNYDLIINSNLS